jgi:predicted GIY-YIG superfamily endonuclease
VESVEKDNRGFDLISRGFQLPGPKAETSFVYAIRCADDTIYIGQTDDLNRRWEEHRQGKGATWTASHGVRYVLQFEAVASRQEAVDLEKKWKTGSGREQLRAKLQNGHLPAGRQVEVRFIEVKGRAAVSEIALTSNEYKTAERLKKDYWLYAVFNCATDPKIHLVQDPARLGWEPIVKVEHYHVGAEQILAAESKNP